MYKAHRFDWGTTNDRETANRQTASLAGLAVALLLVVVGLFLVKALQHKSNLEDCLLSGRTNCETYILYAR
ncbi:MAG: hypothetical protein JOY70_09590 [Acidisphaera sp.]|nr:hypothetical protein [Acidisphaera sp.]MBV9813191.1 hypothetical protein [Acetobacteraceae bacterium]